MATIRDIASEADVSIATVSRVLNDSESVSDDIRSRVQRVAVRMGYRIARRASTNTVIALAYTEQSSLDSPYDVALLTAMAKSAEKLDCDLAIINLSADRVANESPAQLLHRKNIAGVILRTSAATRQICIDLANERFPHVVVGDCFVDEPVNYVFADSRPTSYRAIEHLLSLGHRRIAIAIGHVPDRDHADRLAAYEDALREHGIEVDPKLVYRVSATRSYGEQVIRNLMSLPDRPTAIFIADPFVTTGAINQAHQMRVRIPEDVSIIGFDDAETRKNVFPVYSSVCQDASQLGYEAMSSLHRCLQGGAELPLRKVLPTVLELHKTTGWVPIERSRILPDGSRIEDSSAVDGTKLEVPGSLVREVRV